MSNGLEIYGSEDKPIETETTNTESTDVEVPEGQQLEESQGQVGGENLTEDTTNTPDDTPKDPTKPEDNKETKKPNSAQARIKELAQQKNQWKQKALELEARLSAIEKVEQPNREDYEDDAAYVSDMIDFRAQSKIIQNEVKQYEQAVNAVAQADEQAIVEVIKSAASKFADLPGILQTTDLPTTPLMMEAIRESEVGEDLVYHLATHPEECIALSDMSDRKAALALDRLEARLKSKAQSIPNTSKTPSTQKPSIAPQRVQHGNASNPNPKPGSKVEFY